MLEFKKSDYDEIRLHGENAELRDEVTELARKYGIVTPYTAYLIVEDEQRRDVPMSVRSMPELQRDSAAREEAHFSLFPRQRRFAALAGGAVSRAHLRRQRACGAELPRLRRLKRAAQRDGVARGRRGGLCIYYRALSRRAHRAINQSINIPTFFS